MAETVKTLRDKLARVQARVRAGQAKATEMVGTVLQTAEVGGTGFGFAYLRGRMGDDDGEFDVAGIPVGLASGLLAHLLGFAGFFGGQASHVHNIGDGAIAEYGCHIGYNLGQKAKAERAAAQGYHRFPRQSRVSGRIPPRNPTAQAPTNPFARARAR